MADGSSSSLTSTLTPSSDTSATKSLSNGATIFINDEMVPMKDESNKQSLHYVDTLLSSNNDSKSMPGTANLISIQTTIVGKTGDQIVDKTTNCEDDAPIVDIYERRPINVPAIYNPMACRLWIALLLMFSLLTSNIMRSNLSIALVCMVKPNGLRSSNIINITITNNNYCIRIEERMKDYDGRLDWNQHQRAMLFSSYSWSALLSVLPAGWLADRYGARHLLTITMSIMIVPTALIPIAVHYAEYWTVVVARLLIGFGEGFLLPSVAVVIAHWFPPIERSAVVSIYTIGTQLSAIVINPLGAVLCRTAVGWSAIFYFSAGLGCVWLALWLAIFADSPHDCKHISSAEQAYLMQLLNRHHPTMKERRSLRTLDWKRILTNMPIYAILLADFGTNFQSTLMHSFLPTYLNDVLYLQLGIIGVLTMLPFVVQIVFKFVWSLLAYFLMHRPAFSQHATFVCKSFHLVSSIGSAMAFIGLGLFVDCKLPTLGIALLIVHGIFFAAIVPGYKTSALCIAPSYNGMIASAMTFSGIIGASISPIVVGQVLNSQHDNRSAWRIIFLVNASVVLSTGIFFTIFGSNDIQRWAVMKGRNTADKIGYVVVDCEPVIAVIDDNA